MTKRMQKRLLLLLGLAACFSPLLAQIERPVKWAFSTKPGDNGQVMVQFTATIDAGWHLYSQFIEEGGPIPTTFTFEDAQGYTRVGKVKELGDLHKAYDETFEMELSYFDKKVTFSQAVTLQGESAVVSGYLEFMVCDDEKCLPPEAVDFSIPVTRPAAAAATPAQPAQPETAPATLPQPGTSAGSSPIPSLIPGVNPGAIQEPVKWAYEVVKGEGGQHRLLIKAAIQPGWKIYSQNNPGNKGPIPTSFRFQPGGYRLEGKVEEIGERHEGFDDVFKMKVAYLTGDVRFEQIVVFENGVVPVNGELEYMACNENGCLPPTVVEFSVGGAQPGVTGQAGDEVLNSLRLQNLNLNTPASDCVKEEKTGISLWSDFLKGFLGGLIALLTPCVFPMIPLTVSFFTKGSGDRRKGLLNAFLYGLSIFVIYAVASAPFHLIEGIAGNVFNLIATDPWLNLGFFIVFVAFAISFFGYYEITLPSSIANRANSAAGMGNLLGIFFMGLVLCIVSFSCTGPILGSLVAVSASGSVSAWNLTAAMAGFGLALGVPFALFAAFPGWLNSLPKSGSWLQTVKVVLGFVELALAVKFLSNADLVEHWGLLKRETFFLLWIIIGIAMVLYLLGKIRFPHDHGGEKIGIGKWVTIGLVAAFTVYLVPGLFNSDMANRRLLSGFPPPMFYSWYERDSKCPLDLPCYKDLEEGLAVAKASGKPIILDFTGWACVNCRRMEENVWVNPEVFKKLSEEYVLISLYVDDRAPLPEDQVGKVVEMSTGSKRKLRTVGDKWTVFQEENFQHNTQPLYALITPEGELLNQPVAYTPNEKAYLEFLQCGLDAYATKKDALGNR